MLAKQEPSFSSRNENPFESRRVRTQPARVTDSRGSVAARMFLINVRMVGKIDFAGPEARICQTQPRSPCLRTSSLFNPIYEVRKEDRLVKGAEAIGIDAK